VVTLRVSRITINKIDKHGSDTDSMHMHACELLSIVSTSVAVDFPITLCHTHIITYPIDRFLGV
jgi:hypothetical protein